MDIFLKEYIEKVGITLTEEQADKLNIYYEMLVEKNKVMNLTAITEYRDVVIKHFADSIAVVKAFDIKKACTLIDIGTGAGFPGMVLKIIFPEIQITLLDSLNKRINFLNEVISELSLTGIETIHGRAEDYAHNALYREKYDVCVSRAVANLSTLSEYCLPFVKINGCFISYKAGECEEEVDNASVAISRLGGEKPEVVKYTLPDTDIQRNFVNIKKVCKTKPTYPRKAGIPSKEPLK